MHADADPAEFCVTELADQGHAVSPSDAVHADRRSESLADRSAARLAGRSADSASLRHRYNAIPPGTAVKLAKTTSNLFRFRPPGGLVPATLEVSAFTRVD